MMNRPSTSISLGDLVRAIGHLEPTDDITQRAIAELLDLKWEESQADLFVEPTLPMHHSEESQLVRIEWAQEFPLSKPTPIHKALPDESQWIPSILEVLPNEAEVEVFEVEPLRRQ